VDTVKNYSVFRKGSQLSVLAEPDANGTFQLLALGYRRQNGHINAIDDDAALKRAAGIPEEADEIMSG
jgi:hypothetical protein